MISSSRASSPVSSTHQSLVFDLPQTPTSATPEAAADDASQCEFDIDWENIWHCGRRLIGAKKRPRHRRVVGTNMKESWIYRHGANLEHGGVRYWLCRLCHEKRSYSTALYASSGTAHAARHLVRQHQIVEFGDRSPCLATPFTIAAKSASASVRSLSRQTSLGFQLASHFDERSWKSRFVDWVILEDVTFRQASSERLRWLITNGGELASQLLPEHHTTFVRGSVKPSNLAGRLSLIVSRMQRVAFTLALISGLLLTGSTTLALLATLWIVRAKNVMSFLDCRA
jgi:hypothetical protein